MEKFIAKTKTLEVKPIQFIIKEIMLKILKNNEFKAKVFTKFEGCYYFICFNEGIFNFGLADKNKDFILNEIIENNTGEEIYTDDYIAKVIGEASLYNGKFKTIELNLGERINEKIFEK